MQNLIKYFKRRSLSRISSVHTRRLTLVVLGPYRARLSDADYAESPEDEENDPVDTRGGSITLSANGFN